jgi:hypothetical protein
MADDDDGDDGGPVRDPKTMGLFESRANRLNHDDVMFGSPRWLENFREMKHAAIDPLYKDCLKNWMALRFNLQLIQVSFMGPLDQKLLKLKHLLF